jgi:hypothetical protein
MDNMNDFCIKRRYNGKMLVEKLKTIKEVNKKGQDYDKSH